MKRAKADVYAKSLFVSQHPAPSQLDTELIKEVRAVMKDKKQVAALDEKTAVGTPMFIPMPDNLGDAISGCLRRTLGFEKHTSWMRIGMVGEVMHASVSLEPNQTDKEMQEELDKMKQKLRDDFKKEKGVQYNAAHAAVQHRMRRLSSGTLELLGHITALLENSDDDEDVKEEDGESESDGEYDPAASDDNDEDEEEEERDGSSDEVEVIEPPAKKQRKESH